jgi:peptidoglycan/xylan/chitin deacetylase (PgdA/CDA1 family)
MTSRVATGVSGLWVRRTRRSDLPVGLILVQHEISETDGDWTREVMPALGKDKFKAQLEYLGRHYDVVPLREITTRVRERARGDRLPVALTFDDDTSSQASIAGPMLERFGFPATFFLTGNSLNGGSPFWWQDLQVVAERDGDSGASLRRELAEQWPWAGLEPPGQGHVREPGPGLRELAQTIEGLHPDERDAVAMRLRELAGTDTLDPGLSPDAVKKLAGAGFEIGFHTRRHYALPTLAEAELDLAMTEGIEDLEAVVGYRPTSICYPHGKADLRVAEAAQRAGFEIGVTGRFGVVRPGQNPLLLDRIEGRSTSQGQFAWTLSRAAMAG